MEELDRVKSRGVKSAGRRTVKEHCPGDLDSAHCVAPITTVTPDVSQRMRLKPLCQTHRYSKASET
jgi:hypothetical protein